MVHPLVTTSFWSSVILGAGPIAFATLGALLCSRAGILFVGVEGTLLVSCFFSIAGTAWTDSLLLGSIIGVAAGIATALFSGYLSMTLRMGDIVGGLVVQIGAIGLTGFLLDELFASGLTVGQEQMVALWPAFGGRVVEIFFHQVVFVYLAPLVALGIWYFLRTRWGLRVRASGESLPVATAMSIPIVPLRYAVLAAGGAIVGLGGAMLGLAVVGTFTTGVTGGRGFIALACVVLAGWRPFWALGFAALFAASYSYGLQVTSEALGEWIQLLPYVLTLVVMAFVWGQRRGPAEEGRGIPEPDER